MNDRQKTLAATRQRRHYHKDVVKSREYQKKYRDKNPIRYRAMARGYAMKRLSVPENRVNHCLSQARRRAAERGLAFNISITDLLPLPTNCPVFGTPINYLGTRGLGGKRCGGFIGDSLSIYRIDSTLGYVKGNVEIISLRANRIKSDASLPELRLIIAHMERRPK